MAILSSDQIAGAILFVLGLTVVWETRAIPVGVASSPGPGFFPLVIGLLLAGSGLAITVLSDTNRRPSMPDESGVRRRIAVLGTCAFAGLTMELIGYRTAMILSLAFLLGWVERCSPILTTILAISLPLLSYWLFATQFGVFLPRGFGGF